MCFPALAAALPSFFGGAGSAVTLSSAAAASTAGLSIASALAPVAGASVALAPAAAVTTAAGAGIGGALSQALSYGMMGLQAVGQYQQAQAAGAAALAQQRAAEYEGKVAQMQAQDALDRGAEEAMQIGRRGRALAAEQRATLAARGLSLESGSPLSLLEDTRYMTEEDQRTRRYNAEMEAWGYQVEATGQQNIARSISPSYTRNTALLTGAERVASQWLPRQSKSSTDYAWG